MATADILVPYGAFRRERRRTRLFNQASRSYPGERGCDACLRGRDGPLVRHGRASGDRNARMIRTHYASGGLTSAKRHSSQLTSRNALDSTCIFSVYSHHLRSGFCSTSYSTATNLRMFAIKSSTVCLRERSNGRNVPWLWSLARMIIRSKRTSKPCSWG